MPISADLQKIYSVAPVDAYYKEAITLSHSALTNDLHMTNAEFGFKGDVGTGTPADFISIPFTIILPAKDTTGSQQLNIIFSNVDQDLIDDIELMARRPYEPVMFDYRIYIHGDLNAAGNHKQHLVPSWRLSVSGFTVTSSAITAIAAKVNSHNRPFPKVLYTAEKFPGIA